MDGVLASCYASIDHNLQHIGMTPMRWFPGLMEWSFGVEDGFQAYVQVLFDLGRWVFSYPIYL